MGRISETLSDAELPLHSNNIPTAHHKTYKTTFKYNSKACDGRYIAM